MRSCRMAIGANALALAFLFDAKIIPIEPQQAPPPHCVS